ncbi:MAG: Alpha,2-mannosidase [Myxococcales bacterium]|nr:Alpha,2-mannosidase [Myxococcales bacterium]
MRRSICVLGLVVGCGDTAQPPPLPEVTDTTAWVDPRIGTGGLGFAHGSCFVGAVAPHGLAKPGPDTSGLFGVANFQHYSGYFAEDDHIRGFSSVHLHGTGATDYGVLSLMPTLAFAPAKTSVVDYEARFSKDTEHAYPGFYGVTLASGIAVELTATQRALVHRYTFPADGTILIDLAKTLDSGVVDAASIAVDDTAHEVTGQLHHLGGMSAGFGGYTLYFVARASAPWTSHYAWSASNPASQTATTAQGTGVGAALSVPAGTYTIAIGISLVSAAGARANLAAEIPAIDFDAVAAATHDAWAQKLDVVKLTGGTEPQRRTFYTSLYHAFLMPSVIDDHDGTYQLAGRPVQTAQGFHQMSDLSLWDTYRTVSSLYSWLAPDSAHDTARSLVAFGAGLGIFPKWPIANGESGTMLGSSAEIAIADAVLRGITDTGAAEAWPLLRAAAMDTAAPPAGRGGRNDVTSYMQLGFVPDTTTRSVSQTTEYAHDDFALAQLAGALGHTADHDALLARSHGWRSLYDPAVGFLRAKNPDGSFPTDAFDPTDFSRKEYAEADAWQSLWMTGIHDPEGLVQILGGTDATVAKLSMLFDLAKHDWETADPAAMNFPRKYYWAGNEPDINAPFLFSLFGRRDLTAQWSRWVIDSIYSDQPDGVPGNDDGGTMGSWYVLATLGLYPIAGSDQWVIGAPRFPRARITVGGHELAIEAEGVSDAAKYVQSVELDGVPITAPRITHAQLAGASKLHFVMGTQPIP